MKIDSTDSLCVNTIRTLAIDMARNLSGLRLGLEVTSVDTRRKTAEIKHFGTVKFTNLINTSPLNSFIKTIKSAPANVRSAAETLKSNTVYVLNLGIKKPVPEFHWGYFPEPSFPFYRAGIASEFSPRVAPRGRASFYAEIATDGKAVDFDGAEAAVYRGLKRCGMLESVSQIEEKIWLKIPEAYVIYDTDRAKGLAVIFKWLKARGIKSVGRYGAWKYSFMEESVKEGLESARNILAR